jgi:transposase
LQNERPDPKFWKEKRSDCPLVTLGMVLDGSGFVRRSEVFSGNVSEGKTLAKMLEGLEAPQGALVIMDRGIATEENIQWLRDQGYRYLVVSRERKRHFDPGKAVRIENATGERIRLEKQVDENEVRLYCFSEQRAEKERAMDRQAAERFEAALDQLAEGLSKKGTTKRLDKVNERIGRLKQKSRGQGQHYQIDLVPDDQGKNVIALHYTRQLVEGTQATHPGVYCLRSSEKEWSEEELWRTYVMLTDLEGVFRSLKSELGMRPIYHRTEERTDGHLFITVLAYQFVQILRRTLKDHGIEGSWATLRNAMSGQVRVTTTFQRSDERTLHVRKATRPEGIHHEICKALKLPDQPGGVQKMVH